MDKAKTIWQTEFPKKEGKYWFYGYRFGKASMGGEREPELMYVEVHKAQNGLMYVANGHFMFENEVECPHFKEIELPDLPKI